MLANLQVLRAVAAYLVVFVHVRRLFPESGAADFLCGIAYSGVDLFFVISGFIMVYTTSRRTVHPARFFLDRLRRIAPLYFGLTVSVFLFALQAPGLFESTTADAGSLLKSLLFIPYEKSEGRIYPVYYLGWTLNYEMFFYLLFALSMAVHYEKRAVVCAVVISTLVVLGSIVPGPGNLLIYVYSQPIMLDFVLGMLLAASVDRISAAARRAPALPWIAFGLGVAGVLALPSWLPGAGSAYEPPTGTFLHFGVPAALVVAAAVALDKSGVRPARRTLLHGIGDASYSIYLSHFLVIGAVIALAGRLDLGPAARVLLGFASMALTALVGLCLHRCFERPVGAALTRWTSPAPVGQPG